MVDFAEWLDSRGEREVVDERSSSVDVVCEKASASASETSTCVTSSKSPSSFGAYVRYSVPDTPPLTPLRESGGQVLQESVCAWPLRSREGMVNDEAEIGGLPGTKETAFSLEMGGPSFCRPRRPSSTVRSVKFGPRRRL